MLDFDTVILLARELGSIVLLYLLLYKIGVPLVDSVNRMSDLLCRLNEKIEHLTIQLIVNKELPTDDKQTTDGEDS